MKRKEITEFNKAFGYPAPLRPTLKAKHELRYKLIKEELDEYIEAINDNDIIEVADAIGDMLYLVLGAAVEHGLEIEPIFDEIHNSNMSKLGEDGNPIYREDGKVLKGPDYFKPDIKKALTESYYYDLKKAKKADRQISEFDVDVEEYIDKVVKVVAEYYDITLNTLCGSSRKQPLPLARQIVSYLCYERYEYFRIFGKLLTNRVPKDRATFIHGNNVVKNLLMYDKKTITAVRDITKKLKNELV